MAGRRRWAAAVLMAWALGVSLQAEEAASAETQDPLSFYLGVGFQSSIAGQDLNGTPDVKPFHNARKYGYNDGRRDYIPGFMIYAGQQVSGPLSLELGWEYADNTCEHSTPAGLTTVTSQVNSLMAAPVLRWRRNTGNLSLGCRMGWSSFEAWVESSSPTALLGKVKQRSDIFAYEPFLRLDFAPVGGIAFGFDIGYASRNFWQVFNSDGSGVYANAPITEKNPDGTDTAVDLSGLTNKVFAAVIF